MAVKIDTNCVSAVADQIADINKKMEDDFSSVSEAIGELEKSWQGSASIATLEKFGKIKSSYCTNRYNVINNMVLFMKKQVCGGYEQTEAAVTSAAEAFK